MSRIRWRGEGVAGGCPSQGYGDITVQNTEYEVFFKSRYGCWVLEIRNSDAESEIRWLWRGLDRTMWGLSDPSATELCEALVAKPESEWPVPADYEGCVMVGVPLRLNSGVKDAAYRPRALRKAAADG